MNYQKIKRVIAFLLFASLLGTKVTGFAGNAGWINAAASNQTTVLNSTTTSYNLETTASNGVTTTDSKATTQNAQTTTKSSVTTQGNAAVTTTQNAAAQTTTQSKAELTTERKAVWISYIDLGANEKQKKKTKKQFTSMITEMFQNVKDMGMNTVVVHVRPFSDALYESEYYPWSAVVSGKQGKAVNYDPLEIMVSKAHELGLTFEAWINPYRVTTNSASISKLAKDNPARMWYGKSSTKRNVLIYNGQIYYNPAKSAVRQLIVNGVKEIVENYEVDAIHFDDYFYPTFSSYNYKTAFDAKEYNAYVKKQKKAGKSYKSIENWRRNNVNLLVSQVYEAVHEIDDSVEFGISPAGNLDNLKSKYSYYVDIDRWLTKEGYVDYICPQIYWGFENGQYSYDKVLKRWIIANKKGKVKLYVGLAMYRTSSFSSSEWRNKKNIMKRSVKYGRNTGKVDGYYFFAYNSFYQKAASKEKSNLLKELKKK